ncbi:mutator protein MutT [Actinocorallia herbida]|uniref:Mutator protein MutT n=1 Tax=Actinocorallia herbida TaxID=58109 RepID=A0A3N1D6N5_9ACTN|nr:NUDIX domain-containing protein [Actinocorallia herbida]ROO88778.1 mutator protein MutT [Actinocorallia herbida]
MSGPTAGVDYVGFGVGGMVFDAGGRVFLARRGAKARNEAGTWEFPGGGVEFGERMADAVQREFAEEYGMEIEPTDLLGVFDHILADEGQHWVSATFLAEHTGGEPAIREPEKCSEIGWFGLDALPSPLSRITVENVAAYRTRG